MFYKTRVNKTHQTADWYYNTETHRNGRDYFDELVEKEEQCEQLPEEEEEEEREEKDDFPHNMCCYMTSVDEVM